jgi:hypothetical protein
MIASPCRNCSKENLPKSLCAKDCELLDAIQNFQKTAGGGDVSSRQDFAEEMGYPAPLVGMNSLFESGRIEYL